LQLRSVLNLNHYVFADPQVQRGRVEKFKLIGDDHALLLAKALDLMVGNNHMLFIARNTLLDISLVIILQ